MNIVILDAFTTNPGDLSWDRFEDLGNLSVYDFTPEELIFDRCKDADVIIDNKVILNRNILEKLPRLKFIALLSTGYNVIDTEYCTERNIPVSNVPTYSTQAVAQLTFALILEIYNHVGVHNESVHSGEWSECRDFSYRKTPLMELSGKTIGIIGFGKIGSEVAKVADAFGMNILCYVPSRKETPPFDSFTFTDIDTLARNSDIISLHCPLTSQTRGLVGKDFLSKMKKTAIIINTSRGPVVDEDALAEALKNGSIYGAGADVLSSEPPQKDNPLLACRNCIITPHIAWAGYETRIRLTDIVYNNVKAFLNGNPVNTVN